MDLKKLQSRQSNIELLRILLMFFVLIEHADFNILGVPSATDVTTSPIQTYARFFFEAVSLCAVNTFILISGWFGINARRNSIISFIFQLCFFYIGIYFLFIITGVESITKDGIKMAFLLKGGWFVKSYLILYILSPVLNAYVGKADKRTQSIVLVSFFAFQTIYGWLSDDMPIFDYGYSPLSFIGLYLLARYVRIYNPFDSVVGGGKFCVCLVLFVLVTIAQSLWPFLLTYIGHNYSHKMYAYTNPLVVLQSLFLLLLFTKISISNKYINYIAASSFAVFLLHCHPCIYYQYFSPIVKQLYNDYNSFNAVLYIGIFLLIVYAVSILLDLVRRSTYNSVLTIIAKLRKR